MKKTILITGATDGIGLATAKLLLAQGHFVLLHGRKQSKLDTVKSELENHLNTGQIECYIADLSKLSDVDALADAVTEKHTKLDVLINNAGVLKAPVTITEDGLDIRFVVNTLAPYQLTKDDFGKSITGQYFDNDSGCFAAPHPDAMDADKTTATVKAIEELLDRLTG